MMSCTMSPMRLESWTGLDGGDKGFDGGATFSARWTGIGALSPSWLMLPVLMMLLSIS